MIGAKRLDGAPCRLVTMLLSAAWDGALPRLALIEMRTPMLPAAARCSRRPPESPRPARLACAPVATSLTFAMPTLPSDTPR